MHTLFRWHRRLGLLAAIAVISGTLSGVLHTTMAAFQPRPASFDAVIALGETGVAQPVAAVLRQQGVPQVAELNILRWQDRLWYQVRQPRQPQRLYFDAASGERLADGDRLYAEHLARTYLGDPRAKVISARLITTFDDEYPRVNRLLPVWRIAFDRPDAMRVYVDTGNGKLGTLVDRSKAFFAMEFALLHRWSWLGPPVARLVVMSATLGAALLVTLLGVYLYGVRWKHASRTLGLRRVHRVGGIALSAAALAFAGSGLYHLWQGELRGDPASRLRAPEPVFDAAQIGSDPLREINANSAPLRRISLASVDGQPYWRYEPAKAAKPHDHHAAHHSKMPKREDTGTRYYAVFGLRPLAAGDAAHARALAHALAPGAAILGVTPVSEFQGEYGFIFKRLPVQRVDLDDGRALYLDTADGVVAAVIDNVDRAEGWTFAYVHKMDWLIPALGKGGRDIVMASVSVLLLAFVVAGLVFYGRRRSGRHALL